MNKALSLKPKDFEAYYLRGLAYYKKSEYDTAIDNADAALNINQNYYDGLLLKGEALMSQGNNLQAIPIFYHAAELDSKRWEAHWDAGEALLAAGQCQAAMGPLAQALAMVKKEAGIEMAKNAVMCNLN